MSERKDVRFPYHPVEGRRKATNSAHEGRIPTLDDIEDLLNRLTIPPARARLAIDRVMGYRT